MNMIITGNAAPARRSQEHPTNLALDVVVTFAAFLSSERRDPNGRLISACASCSSCEPLRSYSLYNINYSRLLRIHHPEVYILFPPFPRAADHTMNSAEVRLLQINSHSRATRAPDGRGVPDWQENLHKCVPGRQKC